MANAITKLAITKSQLRAIETAAEATYPEEACGLLVGEGAAEVRVTSLHPSDNLADEPGRRFEVDPALSLKLHKSLRHSDQRLVGVFHSHPEGPAKPSAHDLSRAWQPELAWLVTAVAKGRAGATGAFFLSTDTKPRFVELELAVVDDENGSKA
ncbi:MAG: M67 family metallopeptidase [Alphaproteobacteria bacterium]|nr:M67 family metallopeptidase [Alphaproteobacteria bacterium]HJP22401.1 M67 family metallopeptidase [Alphaproteobacteria bacterium]